MNKRTVQKTALIGLVIFLILSGFIWFNKNSITHTPWVTTGVLEWIGYASDNNERIAASTNSLTSVVVLNSSRELLYQLDAKPNSPKSFSTAEFVCLDEYNNLYVLDKNIGGTFEENVERVLKYSPAGKFIGEIYTYRYINENFIITKGKINGMAYFDGAIYITRLENDGFYLERASTTEQNNVTLINFFDYPAGFENLGYARINAHNNLLVIITKAGTIKQYDFSGTIRSEWPLQSGSLPWTAISDNNNNLIYNDIISKEIVRINTTTEERTVLYSKTEGNIYYYLNYSDGNLSAVSDDDILIMDNNGETEILTSYTYSSLSIVLRTIVFIACLLDILTLLLLVLTGVYLLSKIKIDDVFRSILLVGVCIAFGAVITSAFIIKEMNEQYYENIYTDLENVSRAIASRVDTKVLTSLSSPAQINDPEYRRLYNDLRYFFAQLPLKGMKAYQYIWRVQGDTVYAMYDSESLTGVLFPFADYEDSYFQEVAESKQYVYTNDITSGGSWFFVCGPIFDDNGNVAAEIETGYSLGMIIEQTRNMIIQIVLIVIATTIAFLLIMIEFILIMNGYKRNKLDWTIDKRAPFRPELLRAIVFVHFFSINLATALLPMYATNLYRPLFNLPMEFIVTFPFTANIAFVVFSMLLVPNILKKVGIKRIGFMAVGLIALGNILSFAATNMVFLSAGYALLGFGGGAMVLVVNTIISAQKTVEEVNSGFAHFNSAYLAGCNVGVVFGSIIAQFFPYRIVFLFASIFSAVLVIIYTFSVRSNYLKYFYDIPNEESEDQNTQREGMTPFALMKFIFNPVVLVTLLMVLLPYVASVSFTEYFLPVFATENGLTESNVGQLILLSGLFAILFGASLCEYFSRKLPIRVIVIFSLLLNAGAFYLFSLRISIPILILTVVIMAIANIFALTNIQTYYATLYQNTMIPPMKALSTYSIMENTAMAVGPIVFAYILRNDIGKGIKLFAAALALGIIIFVIVSSVGKLPKDSGLNRRTPPRD